MQNTHLAVATITGVGVFLGTFLIMRLTAKESASITSLSFFGALMAIMLVEAMQDRSMATRLKQIMEETPPEQQVRVTV